MDVIPEVIHERERAFADALRADGLRMTHQRLEVIRELASATHHPDADELFRAVRERVPTISRDTVYRTLTTLVARGLIERIAAPGAARFDPDASMHHHFLCTRCGTILDLGTDELGDPKVPPGLPGVREVTSVRLEIKGVCEDCAAREEGRAGDARR
jgi:Fur family peroxide stress response transcriptional regulator